MKIEKTLEKILLYGALSMPLLFSNCTDKSIVESEIIEPEPQRYGSIKGQITKPIILGDNKIYYVPHKGGLNVALQETELTTITDSSGEYTIKDIPEGVYEIQGNSDSGLAKTLGDVSQDPNYDVIKDTTEIYSDSTTVENMKLSPSIGYPRQILHGKLYGERDKINPIIGKQIGIYMTWAPHPAAQSVIIGTSITSDSGRYAFYIGEQEYYFLLDADETTDSTGDVFLDFIGSQGNEYRYLNAWKDTLGILEIDILPSTN